jgi:hypothetical protein
MLILLVIEVITKPNFIIKSILILTMASSPTKKSPKHVRRMTLDNSVHEVVY